MSQVKFATLFLTFLNAKPCKGVLKPVGNPLAALRPTTGGGTADLARWEGGDADWKLAPAALCDINDTPLYHLRLSDRKISAQNL